MEGAGDADIKITSPELGLFSYKASTKAHPPGLDNNVVFKTGFGVETVKTFRFQHYALKPATYTATIQAPPGKSNDGVADFVIETKDIKAPQAEGHAGVTVLFIILLIMFGNKYILLCV